MSREFIPNKWGKDDRKPRKYNFSSRKRRLPNSRDPLKTYHSGKVFSDIDEGFPWDKVIIKPVIEEQEPGILPEQLP